MPAFKKTSLFISDSTFIKYLRKTISYFLSFCILIFPFSFLGQNPSSQLFLCTLHFISPLEQLKQALLIISYVILKKLRLQYYLSIACNKDTKFIIDRVSVIPIYFALYYYCFIQKYKTLWYDLNVGLFRGFDFFYYVLSTMAKTNH